MKTARSGGLRGDIEGLRAIAVGTVLLYHVGVPVVSGGFAGVDIFFVISGFLITSLLLREAQGTSRISLWSFYARRARRLLPAASVVLLFTAIAGWLVLPSSAHGDLATDVAAATAYVVNWALAGRAVDYLAEDAGLSPLQHYWSLSVEEQYYVVWPLVIIVGLFLARRIGMRPRPMLFGVIGLVAVASLVHSIRFTAAEPAAAYFFTTTRVWELAIGSLLAFAIHRIRVHLPDRAAHALAALGLAMIIFAVLLFDSATPWPGSAALVPTLGAAAVIAAGCRTGETLVGRLLALRPMTWLGGISYAVYLWHWPLLVLAEVQWPGLGVPVKLGIGALSIALAVLTKHLVEDPIRFHPVVARRTGVALGVGAAMMATSFGAAAVISTTVPELDLDAPVTGATVLVADQHSAEWRVTKDPGRFYSTSGTVVPHPAVATKDIPIYYRDGCQLRPGEADPRECYYGDPDGEETMLMLGDSKMGQWLPAVNDIAVREGWRLELYLKSACAPSTDGVTADCARFNRNLLNHLAERPVPEYVLASQGSPLKPGLSAGMEEVLGTLQARGSKVILLADNPKPSTEKVYECVGENPDDFSVCGFEPDDLTDGEGTPPLRQVAEALDEPMLDLNEWICPPTGEICPAVVDHTLIYRQGDHLTASYVRTLAPMLHRALSRIGVARTPVNEITVADVARTDPTG